MQKDELREEIELLRDKLYKVLDEQVSSREILQISQKLDQLILEWMRMQKEDLKERKHVIYNT